MENPPNCDATLRRENAALTAQSPLPIRVFDAHDADEIADVLSFHNSSLFLHNTIQSRDGNPPHGPVDLPMNAIDGETSISVDGEGQWVELLEELSQTDLREKPAPATMTWKGKKEELEYLRAQVAELENELRELKATGEDTEDTEPSVWKQIASRQSEAKQKALVENIKLRELLEGQLKVARSLEKLLNKRPLCEPDTPFFTKRTKTQTTHEWNIDALREEIRGRIHKQLDDVDAVMEESGLSLFYTGMEDARATASATTNNAICMEMVVVRVFPFPWEQVGEAMWQSVSADQIKFNSGTYGASQRSESSFDIQYTVRTQLRRAEAVLHVKGVSAHRKESERSLIAYEGVGTTEGTLFALNSVLCREQTFILVEKNLHTSEMDEPSTVVKVCVRVWPDNVSIDEETPTKNVPVRSFIDLVIGCYNQNVMTVLQLVENALVEHSLQSPQ